MNSWIIEHPGFFLAEEIEARGLSKMKFAEILGKTPSEISHILSGRRAITPDIALRMQAAFGFDPKVWLSMQHDYDLYMLSHSKSKHEELKEIKSRAKELALA